jgi:hypothetical protein
MGNKESVEQTVTVGEGLYNGVVKIPLLVETDERSMDIIIRRGDIGSGGLSLPDQAIYSLAVFKEMRARGQWLVTLASIERCLVEASKTFKDHPPNEGTVRVIGVTFNSEGNVEYLTLETGKETAAGRFNL